MLYYAYIIYLYAFYYFATGEGVRNVMQPIASCSPMFNPVCLMGEALTPLSEVVSPNEWILFSSALDRFWNGEICSFHPLKNIVPSRY